MECRVTRITVRGGSNGILSRPQPQFAFIYPRMSGKKRSRVRFNIPNMWYINGTYLYPTANYNTLKQILSWQSTVFHTMWQPPKTMVLNCSKKKKGFFLHRKILYKIICVYLPRLMPCMGEALRDAYPVYKLSVILISKQAGQKACLCASYFVYKISNFWDPAI